MWQVHNYDNPKERSVHVNGKFIFDISIQYNDLIRIIIINNTKALPQNTSSLTPSIIQLCACVHFFIINEVRPYISIFSKYNA